MEFRKCVEYGWRSTQVYEMRLGRKWYKINRRNIETHGTFEQIRNFFNAALQGLTVTVQGRYSPIEKKLVLEL